MAVAIDPEADAATQKAIDLALVVIAGTENPTPDDLDRAVDLALQTISQLFPGVEVEARYLRRVVEASVSVFVGEASVLGDDRGHEDWLNRRRSEIEWRFWNAYRRYLIANRMPVEVVTRLDAITDDIIGRLEWPRRPGAWDRRGMLVGQVQSGKTANYTGLVCKAADAGYKVIVVLAGMHNSLRSQTQRRLDEGFLGLDSRTGPGFAGTQRAIGVGEGGMKHPGAMTMTSSEERGDFSIAIASRIAARIDRDSPPVLLVLKKNATILRNFIEWITSIHERSHPDTGRMVIPELPLLIIDDEADNASVNTKDVEMEVDEDGNVIAETDPTTINRLIRKLLFSFEQSAYVGYTATPFANIFIYEDKESPAYGEDLFPRSFILRIKPPSNYMGPAEVFGVSAEEYSREVERTGLPIVRTVDDTENWVPGKHRKEWVPGALPPSLKRAIRSFIVTCAARAARGERTVHNSMLVHVTRYVAVQAHVGEQVEAELLRLTNQLRYGDGHGASSLREALRLLWEEDYVKTTAAMPDLYSGIDVSWDDVSSQLSDSASKIVVRRINGSAGDALEYTDHPDGISVIAIGGDKLSRGLTLEGLSVSYYLRASKMYDTLMQMGRWFGYRPGYGDLCRLFTTQELQLWYRNITVAGEELLAKFDEMAAVGSTPERFALYVRTSPDGLLVTAPAKMRNSKRLELTFSANIVETTIFERDETKQLANFKAVDAFFTRETRAGLLIDERVADNYVWRNVPGADVAELLASWQTAETAQKARGPVLAQYVRSRLRADELTDWTVVMVSKRDSKLTLELAGLEVGLTERGPDPDVDPPDDMYVTGRLVSPSDEWIDLTPEQKRAALDLTVALWERGESKAQKRPSTPSGPSVRACRPPQRGLLLVYPLDPGPPRLEDIGGALVSFAVSFPESPGAPTISYMVPNRYWQADFGF
jgi:hypothetical protein